MDDGSIDVKRAAREAAYAMPLSEINRLVATSRCVKPASCVLVRSTSMRRCGSSNGCSLEPRLHRQLPFDVGEPIDE